MGVRRMGAHTPNSIWQSVIIRIHKFSRRARCGIKTVTLMDYEYQPANHLAFRLTSRIIVPASFPAKRLRRYGASVGKVRRYHGTKEDVYLADFQPDPLFAARLCELGVNPDNVLVLMRPPAHDALYHRFQNALFDEALAMLLANENVQVILLPRNEAQRALYSTKVSERLMIPAVPLDGANLIAFSDLVISAGGTINREAAALGVPAVSIYAGKWAAVDEELVKEGRLRRISNATELHKLPIEKKQTANPRRSVGRYRRSRATHIRVSRIWCEQSELDRQ